MNILKKFGAKLKVELGDLLIYTGLSLLPITTYQINKIAASYVLSAILIVLGVYIIKSGGD